MCNYNPKCKWPVCLNCGHCKGIHLYRTGACAHYMDIDEPEFLCDCPGLEI